MLNANITEIFTSHRDYENRINYFKGFNHVLVKMSEQELVFIKDQVQFRFELNFYEKDFFTKTYLSVFEDGAPFRVVVPIGISKEMMIIQSDYKSGSSVGSLNPEGYSVTFMLSDREDI